MCYTWRHLCFKSGHYSMKWLIGILFILLCGLQYKLWLGTGSMSEVWRLQQSIVEQQAQNEVIRDRNSALDAEVQDLKQGLDAIEGRARSEMGMVKKDETFFQIVDDAQGNE